MKMPAVALRGMVILPGMIAHFDVSREKSIHAVEQSMMDEQKIDIGHAEYKLLKFLLAHPERVFFVHGNADDVVELEHTYQWCRPQGISVMVMPEAGHFFHGRLIELGQIIDRYGLS